MVYLHDEEESVIVPSTVANMEILQAVIHFYEKHLVFGSGADGDGGRATV